MKLIIKYYTFFIILFLSCEQDNAIATIDCEGTIGGIFEYDECGDCRDPQDPDYNSDCTDCDGNVFGDALLDNCGVCDTESDNDCIPDCSDQTGCNGDWSFGQCWGGTALLDACGICVIEGEHPSVDTDGDNLCDGIDSNNDDDGECDICTGEGQPHSECTANDIGQCVCYQDQGITCDDCVEFHIDHCGVCNGNGVDVDFQDRTNDECTALGGTWHYHDRYTQDDNDTPDDLDDDVILAPCGDGICDGNDMNGDGLCDRDGNNNCDGEDSCLMLDPVIFDIGLGNDNCGLCNGSIDDCGVCNGNGLDEDQDGLCDNIDTNNDGSIDDSCLLGLGPNEDGILDECNVCGGNGIAEGTCDCDGNVEDCRNVCGGDALIDECGECYNWVDNTGVPYLVSPMVDFDSDGLCDGIDGNDDGECNICTENDINVPSSNCNLSNIGTCACYGDICNDECPLDPENDSDNDGLCGDIDTCIGDNSSGNTDNDDLCDDTDSCPNDAENDIDGDGICGDIDVCPYDSDDDSDNDGVCGDIDTCPDNDDNVDTDSDGVADGCDVCEGFDDNLDTDSDGLADGCDTCPNDADNDIDGDEICGDVDTCPNDANNDADNDNVCGDIDVCIGFDDNIDSDSDGDADGCDTCPNDADNDIDGDGICGDVDSCPNDPNNDSDSDSICDDVDDCIGNIYDECNVCNGSGIAEGECDCDGNTLDCNNVCDGSATLDCNNTCEGPATIDQCGICSGYNEFINDEVLTFHPSVDTDNDGLCDGTDADGDGNCDTDSNGDCDGEDDCLGNNFDGCGICNGTGVDSDDDDICDDVDDCIGNVYDECDLCFDVFSGQGEDIDDDGLCDNYDVDGDGFIDDTCIDTDNDGVCDHLDNCIDVDGDSICDDEDECVGIYDQCGVCNGDNSTCQVGDACDLPVNTIYVHNNSQIWYNVDFDITSFTFEFDTDIISHSGGDADEELDISYNSNYIHGGNGLIPAGCGTLIDISFSGNFNAFTKLEINYDSSTVNYCDSCIYENPCSAYPTNSITLLNDDSVFYNVDFNIGGFQWDVDGATVTGVIGGDAQDAGFTVQASGSTVLGFSFTSSYIPVGCGTLTEMTLSGTATGLSGIVFSNADGIAVTVTLNEIDNTDDDDSDECVSGFYDCAGICDGNAVEDECGVCDGDGLSCSDDGGSFDACSLSNNTITLDENNNVYYNVDFDIGGFQWVVDNAIPLSSSGGDAESAGFTVSASEATLLVLGFSFTGGFVPAGCGILTQMTLTGNATGLSDIVFSNSDGSAVSVSYE